MDFYDMEDLKAEVGVWYKNSAESKAISTGYSDNGTFLVMFDSKTMTVDKDNNVIMEIKVARAGSVSEYIVEEENFGMLDGIEKGDLIRIYGQDSTKTVDRIDPCTYNGKNIGPKNLPWDCIDTGKRVSFRCGDWSFPLLAMECYKKASSNDAIVQYGQTISENERENKALCFNEGKAWSMGGVLLYDETSGIPEVSAGSYEDLRGADVYGRDACSIVLFFSYSASARATIIYNLSSNSAAYSEQGN